MTTIYSEDGVTVTSVYREAPEHHWVQDTPDSGHYEPADLAHGYFPLVEVERPSMDHNRTAVRSGDTFVETWTFDQALADANAVAAVEQAERDQIKNFIGNLDAYLALDVPTNAQVVQQVDRLTRAIKRLIKDNYGSP